MELRKQKMKHTIKLAAKTLLLISAAALTSCYSWFETKGSYDTSIMVDSLDDLLRIETVNTTLESPSQLIVSQGEYPDTIKLTWKSVENAKSYRIERATINAGDEIPTDDTQYTKIRDYVYALNYTDKLLDSPTSTSEAYGKKYVYRICAENIGKGYTSSGYTDPTTEETNGEGWLLPPPSKVDAWKGKSTDTIQVSWQSVENAQNYDIYRGEKENGTGMEKIGSVRGNQNTYDNVLLSSEQGVEFYYKVMAVTAAGNQSVLSSIAMGYSLTQGAPTAPDNIQVTNGLGTGDKTLNISWDPVTSADPNIPHTYSLYRTSSQDSVFTLIKNNIPESTTSETDKSVKPGLIYYYYLQTIATNTSTGEKQKSAFSETGPDSSTPAQGFILSAPASLEILDSTTEGKVNLRWSPAVGSDFEGVNFTYTVYSCDTENGTFTTLQEGITGTESSGYLTEEIEAKKFYKISTVNVNTAKESDMSSAAAPMPPAPTQVTASRTKKLSDSVMTANDLGVYPVEISWTKAEDAYAYYVFRSTSATGPFRKLNDAPTTDNTYIDSYEGAKAGVIYYYRVVSVNTLGQGNKGNDPSSDSFDTSGQFKDKWRTSWGYGAITRDQWFREYNKSVKASQKKLTLMHKSNDMDKLGSETINGDISGTLSYKAAIAGLGAEITMPYSNYADFYIADDSSLGVYFTLTGNTDTTSNMSANGNMHGTVKCTGMYPGQAVYNNLEIKGGAAGGGYYAVTTNDLSGSVILSEDKVDWTVGEE